VSQQELLIAVVTELDRVGVAYMLTGSFASSLQGEPRATHDIDLVIAVDPAAVPALARVFREPGYYLDEASAAESMRAGRMFNLINVVTGDKVDFWPLADEPFDHARFGRRQRVEVAGRPVHVSSPEDTILMKLNWSRQSGGSEKQFGDALRVYEVQAGGLDHAYLETWAERLGVVGLWRRLLREAEPV
jgi:hypothetical protein